MRLGLDLCFGKRVTCNHIDHNKHLYKAYAWGHIIDPSLLTGK